MMHVCRFMIMLFSDRNVCVCVWGGVGGTENIYKENLIHICPL